MKRFMVLMLTAAFAISVAACKNNDNGEDSTEESIVAESPVIEESPKSSWEESVEKSEPSETESSAEVSKISSADVEKTLEVYENFSKKYHNTDLWDSIKCYGRFKKDSEDGYYKKGDLVRIIGKYEDKSSAIIYTDSGGVNFEKADIIEFFRRIMPSRRAIDL